MLILRLSLRLYILSPVIDCFLHSHRELCSPLFLACFVFVVKLCWPLISQVPYVSVCGPHSGDPWETCQSHSCVFILYAYEEVMLDNQWPYIPCVWRGCASDVAAIRCMSVKPWSSSRVFFSAQHPINYCKFAIVSNQSSFGIVCRSCFFILVLILRCYIGIPSPVVSRAPSTHMVSCVLSTLVHCSPCCI